MKTGAHRPGPQKHEKKGKMTEAQWRVITVNTPKKTV